MSATASTSAAELGTASDAGDVEPGALLSVLDDAQTTPCNNASAGPARGRSIDRRIPVIAT